MLVSDRGEIRCPQMQQEATHCPPQFRAHLDGAVAQSRCGLNQLLDALIKLGEIHFIEAQMADGKEPVPIKPDIAPPGQEDQVEARVVGDSVRHVRGLLIGHTSHTFAQIGGKPLQQTGIPNDEGSGSAEQPLAAPGFAGVVQDKRFIHRWIGVAPGGINLEGALWMGCHDCCSSRHLHACIQQRQRLKSTRV